MKGIGIFQDIVKLKQNSCWFQQMCLIESPKMTFSIRLIMQINIVIYLEIQIICSFESNYFIIVISLPLGKFKLCSHYSKGCK